MEQIDLYLKIADVLFKVFVSIIGGGWAFYKLKEFRAFKYRIQFDIDANIYKLTCPKMVSTKTWDKNGEPDCLETMEYTHVVEIMLKFTNKGNTRFKLFNIQAGIETMREPNQVKIDKDSGRVKMTRTHTSGNIVPLFSKRDCPPEGHKSFYYIEPGVEQIISYICLSSNPKELIKVFGKFNMEQKRLFPKVMVGKKGLLPHSASRTFKIEE